MKIGKRLDMILFTVTFKKMIPRYVVYESVSKNLEDEIKSVIFRSIINNIEISINKEI